MYAKSARFILAATTLALVACNPTQPVTPTNPPSTATPSTNPQAPGARKAGLDDGDVAGETGQPVIASAPTGAAPGEIVLQARWKSPEQTIKTMAAFAKLPSSLVKQGVDEMVKEIVKETLRSKVDVRKFAKVVDAAAPIDLVVALDTKRAGSTPRPMYGFSFGLTSLGRALDASKGKPRKIAAGMWRLGDDNSWGAPCAVVATGGKIPARVVCGDRTRDLLSLGPYLGKTLGNQAATGGDFHAEIRLRGLFNKYGAKWSRKVKGLPILAEEGKIGVPAFDDALMDAAAALAAEAGSLIHDLDRLDFDVSVDATKGVVAKGRVRFAGKHSWLVQSIADTASVAGPAPPIFWAAPKTSAAAGFGYSADPARYNGVFKTARVLLKGLLEKEKIGTAADRQAIAKLLSMPFKKHTAGMQATGYFGKKLSKSNMFLDLIGGSVGWQLMGIEQKATDLRAYFQDVVKVYNRATLQKLMKKALGSEAKYLPKVRTVRAPASLGRGALDIEIAVANIENPMSGLKSKGRATGPKKKVTLKMHLLLMADGKRTWMGFAFDRNKLAKLMVKTKANKSADSLASLSTLGIFKAGKHTSGAFTTLAGLLDSLKPAIEAGLSLAPPEVVKGPGKQVLNLLKSLPNKGATPITFLTSAKQSGEASFRMSLPGATLADLGYVGEKVFKMLTTMKKKRPSHAHP